MGRITIYQRRNRYLLELGFKNYKSYLKSSLWKSIRARVRATRKTCSICRGNLRLEVHHVRYTWDNVRGKNIKWLTLLCHTCHNEVSKLERRKNITPQRATNSIRVKKQRPRRLKSPSQPATQQKSERLYV